MRSALGLIVVAILAACSPPAAERPAAPPADVRAVAAKPEAMLSQLTVAAPAANARLTSPFKVSGQAPGFWYFEAIFPITLVDESGKLLAEAPGQAVDNWMTEQPVRFESEVKFVVTEETPAWLVFSKENMSGEPVNDGEVRIPVTLLPGPAGQ